MRSHQKYPHPLVFPETQQKGELCSEACGICRWRYISAGYILPYIPIDVMEF